MDNQLRCGVFPYFHPKLSGFTYLFFFHVLVGSLEFGWTSEATSHDGLEELAASTRVFL